MQNKEPVSVVPEFLSGGGEMGQRIREYDWSQTPLGPVDTWPHSLRTCIRIMLTSRQPIWIGWGKELIKFYNDPYKAIVGGKHPWALGTPASIVWKDIWKDIEPMLKQVMEKDEGTYVESQLLIMERNGYPEETYYTFSYTPIPGDDGKTEGMFCANTEDTEKIISERQLRTLTLLGKRLADCRTNGQIVETTIETVSGNPYDFPFAFFRTIAENKATLVHSTPLGESEKSIPREIDLNAPTEMADTIKKAVTTRQPQVIEHLSKKMGSLPSGAWEQSPDKLIVLPVVQPGIKEAYGTLIVGLNPYRLPDEKYLGFFSLVADQVATAFGDVYVLEQERKRAEALAEIDRAKTHFFSNISHEFRTPLTLMMAPIEDVLNDARTIDANRIRLDVARRNASRLLKMVNTLLDFSRIEAGRMQAGFEPVQLAQLTRGLASTFRSAIERAGMELVVECDELSEPVYVDVDMWEKIVLNLLSNAFKYTHHGRIAVRLKQEGERILFSVSDTGIGIPSAELEKIFERFHRIQNINGRSQEGTGIGLALVQELVRLHKGTIEVESKEHEGSVFTISLQTGKEHLPSEQVLETSKTGTISLKSDFYVEEALKWLPDEQKSEGMFTAGDEFQALSLQSNGQRSKILLADDNNDMLLYLQQILSGQYEVTTVGNGKAALNAARQKEYDLVLSDVMMPEMDGFELVKNLKEHPKTKYVPVVLLSARAGEEATIEGLQAGADDYLVKPFSARELLSRIDSNIKIAQSRINAAKQLYNLFMNAPVAITILRGSELRYELTNERYLEVAGKKDLVGKTLEEAFPELEGQGVKEILRKVFETGTPYFANEFEAELMREGKRQKIFFNFICTPLREVDQSITGLMVVLMEVTQMVMAKKLMEQNEARLEEEVQRRTLELQRANEALERSNKELEQYAFVTSHDLQEPLRKIQTFATMLYEHNKNELDERSVQHYQKVLHAAKRMSGLINDLLEFSRLSRQEQFTDIELDEVVKNVMADFELLIQGKNALLKTNDLPKIEAIPLQMNQLFSNLLGNALKFSSNERRLEISIIAEPLPKARMDQFPELKHDREYVSIVVSDNGIGFDPAYRNKIFEIFQRLNDRGVYEGTGIGLALCARIVANHRGVIFAESEENKGSSFHIILPVKQTSLSQ